MEKLIITAAVTGSLTPKEASPYIPYTPREIADEALRAWEAGAAIVHLHMRDDEGRPSADVNRFVETVGYIREKSDVIINTTTSGGMGQGIPPEERIKAVPACKPELATLLANAMIMGRFDKKRGEWVGDRISGPTFAQLEHFAAVMRETGTRPEVEVMDVAAIRVAEILVEAGALTPPLLFGLVLGMGGQAIPGSVKNLMFLIDSLPPGSTWTCMGIGRHEFTLGAVAITLGGNVRVGFEDNIYLDKGVLAKSNAELVEKMVRISRELGREIASPSEARQILGLKAKP